MLNLLKDSCPNCHGSGEIITALDLHQNKCRHEKMSCLDCEGTGSLEIFILNKMEETCRCHKHRLRYGQKAVETTNKLRLKKIRLHY